ncbi:hypothetical protein ABTY98_06325 [Streptomyces sp. NPDC096040]|uniref:hypothetical protein n=1 Tax=Streptomyces sp. NPDC096040 TaxID=3155541 RepID=UPI00331BCFE4
MRTVNALTARWAAVSRDGAVFSAAGVWQERMPGGRLPYGEPGPGLSVEKLRCAGPTPPFLDVTTVTYDMTAGHSLLEPHRLLPLALHRHSRLALAAGRVTDPLPFPEYSWEDDQ